MGSLDCLPPPSVRATVRAATMAGLKVILALAFVGFVSACEWQVSLEKKAGLYSPLCEVTCEDTTLSNEFKAFQELPMLTDRNTMVCMRFQAGNVTECAMHGYTDLSVERVDTAAACSSTCPKGFTRAGDECYMVSKPGTYWQVKAACRDTNNAQLAEIRSQAQQDAIQEFLARDHTGVSVYINMNDAYEEGKYVYASGEKGEFFNWFAGEPNNRGNEDCVVMRAKKGYKWVDLRCNKKERALCQFKPTY